jgi:hypothetical protein
MRFRTYGTEGSLYPAIYQYLVPMGAATLYQNPSRRDSIQRKPEKCTCRAHGDHTSFTGSARFRSAELIRPITQ